MRFLVQPGLAPRARPPVRAFLLFAALALGGFAAQRVHAGGLSAAGVEAFYLGADGGEPLSTVALWEELHVGAFVYGFVLFMLGSLLVACHAIRPGVRGALYGAAFAATLSDLAAPFAISAFHGGGALRVATFAAAAVSLALLLVTVTASFGRGGADARG